MLCGDTSKTYDPNGIVKLNVIYNAVVRKTSKDHCTQVALVKYDG